MDSFDVALLRQAADEVGSVAAGGAFMPPATRSRLRVIATELRGAAADLVDEETRRSEATA